MMEPYDNPETIRRLYYTREMTIPEVADELGCSTGTIYNRMDEHDIERRQKGHWRDRERQNKEFYNTGTPPSLLMDGSGYEMFVSHYNGEQDRLLHHRLLAVAKYGFDEVSGNIVHHKNEVKWDNRNENLIPMTAEEHGLHHNSPTQTEAH